MAVHRQLWSLAEEAIDEYLEAVKQCLDFRKPDGGCLGYPATRLLFCILDAFGAYLSGDDVIIEGTRQKISRTHPFRVLNHSVLAFGLTHGQIRTLEDSCRNALAHEGLIRPGISLISQRAGPVFAFSKRGVTVAVRELYIRVADSWTTFDKRRIKSAIANKYSTRTHPLPVNVQISSSLFSSVSSASYVTSASGSGKP